MLHRVTQQGRSSRGAHRRLACTSCDIGLDELEVQRMAAYGGRCTNCQQLHKEGSFCPVCSKVPARGPARPHTMPAGTPDVQARSATHRLCHFAEILPARCHPDARAPSWSSMLLLTGSYRGVQLMLEAPSAVLVSVL